MLIRDVCAKQIHISLKKVEVLGIWIIQTVYSWIFWYEKELIPPRKTWHLHIWFLRSSTSLRI